MLYVICDPGSEPRISSGFSKMKKVVVLILVALFCVPFWGNIPQAASVAYAQKRGDDKPRKKDPPGAPVQREKRDREKPPPPPKPRKH